MPRNGAGQYNAPAGNPVVTDTTITSTWANNTVQDIGNELTNSIAKDGQTPPTANLPMGGFRHTGAANAVGSDDYTTLGQMQATTGAANVGADDGSSGSIFTTVQGFISKILSSDGASIVGFIQSGTGAVTRTLQSKNRDKVSIKDFGSVCDGTTDDTAANQLALNSGAKIVDFLGLPSKCDTLTIPAGVSCIGLNIVKKNAGGNVVLVNTGCSLQGKITGTGTKSIVERGVYPAANNVTDVNFDLECASLTYGVHAQPSGGGYLYADAPKRWFGKLRLTGIVGTAGVSEGYGLLLSPAYHCQFSVVSNSPEARHTLYLSAGSSYNNIEANIVGGTNYACQIYSASPQPACEYNTIKMKCYGLTETVAGQSGPAAIVGQSNFNAITFDVSAGNAITYGATVEGASTGPYPFGNKIINCSAYGQFMGADVIRLLNADSTIVEGNNLNCYGTTTVIALRKTGTNGSVNAGFISNNTINAMAQNVKGIYNECNTQPSYIGINDIRNNGSALRVDDQSGGKRLGYSRRVVFSGTTASIAGLNSGDTTVTLSDNVQVTGRRTNVVSTGSSGTYFNSPHTLVGVSVPGSETQVVFRWYNGAAGAQTFNYEGVVEGD